MDEMMKLISSVLFYLVSAKNINSHCFTWFLTLDNIQDGGQDAVTMFDDVKDLQRCNHP